MVQTPASTVNNRVVRNPLPAVNPSRVQTSVPAVNYRAPFLPKAQHNRTSPNHPSRPVSLPYITHFIENLDAGNAQPSRKLGMKK